MGTHAAATGSPVSVDPTLAGQEPVESWPASLRSADARTRDEAIRELHALLLRGARFELRRRAVTARDADDMALQAADDALGAVLAKLDTFRGASRFTTWAYKFALLEAGVRARRRSWEGREVSLEPEDWPRVADGGPSAHDSFVTGEVLRAIRRGVDEALTPHQREVFCALALNGVPIDVLAERLTTTRGALYKTLHDARRRLRSELAAAGLGPDGDTASTGGRP
jgi:RNA polymerase sigma-70 factor (ECF subfamily)